MAREHTKKKKIDVGGLNMFDNLPEMVILIDPKDYSIIDANRAYIKKEGTSKKNIIGRKCYEVTHRRSSPCRGPSDFCPLRITLTKNKIARVDHIHYDKNNNPFYVEIVTSLIKDPTTKKKFILHISRRGPLIKKFNELVHKKSKKYFTQLKKLIIKDPLTNAYNYSYFMERLPVEIKRSERYSYPLSVGIVDIDYFKSINDTYGHQAGNNLLTEFAGYLKKMLRDSDILVRRGGEEFVILLMNTDRLEAHRIAVRLVNRIGSHAFKIKGTKIKIKASIGIATFSKESYCNNQERLLSAADMALQRAKNSGGNNAVVYSELYKNKKSAAKRLTPYEEVRTLKRRIQKLSKRVDRVVLESIYAFSKSMEARDYYTAEHAEEMVAIALKIGKELGLDKGMLAVLERGAVLHDIGKIGISDVILRKKSKLTPEEYRIIKMHPKIGAEIIRAIHFLKDVVPIVLHHHERIDGGGYPSGLKDGEIPLSARIIAIADAYQALISDRPYRRAYSRKEAFQILKKEAGEHFDPDLVKILLKLEQDRGKGKRGSKKKSRKK